MNERLVPPKWFRLQAMTAVLVERFPGLEWTEAGELADVLYHLATDQDGSDDDA